MCILNVNACVYRFICMYCTLIESEHMARDIERRCLHITDTVYIMFKASIRHLPICMSIIHLERFIWETIKAEGKTHLLCAMRCTYVPHLS